MGTETSEPSARTLATFCEPPEQEAQLRPLFQALANARQRPLLIIAEDHIAQSTSLLVHGVLREAASAGVALENMCVLLHSPGGSLTESYRIARLLARASNKWCALVPWMAASGATLIALGSAEIVLGPFAFLSPIDPQVVSRRPEKFFVERQSSLEAFQALSYLQQFSLEAIDTAMTFLLEHQLTAEVALNNAIVVASNLVQPILQSIEPYALGGFSRDTEMSIEYARRISNPVDQAKQTQREADFERMVKLYPGHEFLIDFEEAQELGLTVSEPDDTIDSSESFSHRT